MKRFRSLPHRRDLDRRRHVRLQAFQSLEDRSLMALTADGTEFLVADADRGSAGVAANANGDYLVTYSGAGEGDSQGVFARRYGANGTPLTENLLINGTTAGYQGSASGALGTDRAVIVWSGRGEGDSQGIYAGVFGAVNSDEIAVNVTKGGVQDSPVVALAANGSFVVAWSGMGAGDRHGIFLRQFAADGTPLTGEVLVSSNPGFVQRSPSIAMNAAGQVVVTWLSLGQDGDSWGVFGQRFNASLAKQGGELQVNSNGSEQQTNAEVAIASDGSFVVAWGSETASWEVLAQRFAANGSRQGSEVQVNTGPLAGQPQLDVASALDGPYVVAWTAGPRSTTDILGQAFLADSTRDGGEFLVTNAAGPGAAPSVALDQQGDAVFAWSGQAGANAIQLESDRDRTPPTITASLTSQAGNDGTVTEVRIGGTIQDVNPVTGIRVNLDGGAFHDIAVTDDDLIGPYTITPLQLQAALGVLPVGTHIIGVRAVDEDGNLSTTEPVSYNLDLPPVVTVRLTSDNGLSASDEITTAPGLTYTVTDAGAVPKLQAKINDGAFVDINTTTPNHVGTFTISEATLEGLLNPATLDGVLPDGQYTVQVRATDAKQNTSQVAELQFTLDRVAPTLNVPNIADFFFQEDATIPPGTADMTNLFTGSGLQFTIVGNTNTNVVAATVEGSDIRLDLMENRNTENQGQPIPSITVRATKPNGLSVDASFEVEVAAAADTPTVVHQLRNLSIAASAPDFTLRVGGAFGDVDEPGSLVRFDMDGGLGTFGVEVFNTATPNSVQNFLSYVNAGDYTNSVFHRSIDNFILQGGFFKFDTQFEAVPTHGSAVAEPVMANLPGTLVYTPSRDNNFFFNLVDNSRGTSVDLDNQAGSFSPFGRLIGNGMTVINSLAAIPTTDLSPRAKTSAADANPQHDLPFIPASDNSNKLSGVSAEDFPLRDYTAANNTARVPITANNVVRFSRVVVDPTLSGAKGGDAGLTITAVSSNPALLQATVVGKSLTLNPTAGSSGTATITVTATDTTGRTAQQSFTVTVTASALMLAGSDDTPLPTSEQIADFNPRALSPEMEGIVDAAVGLWASTGLGSEDISRIDQANVMLADLPSGMLGLALGDSVWLDADAGGRGWFLDPTPGDDLEFGSAGLGVDLLSVVAHEFGHVLGLPDVDAGDDLMSDSLSAGVRRLPTASVDALFSSLT